MKEIKIKYNDVPKINTIKELIDLAVKEAGDKNAFEYKEKNKPIEVTYKEFKTDINGLGTALMKIGMDSKHMATIGENSYKWLTTYLTALRSNGVFVPIDKELTKNEIINVLRSSESELLFYSSKFENYIKDIKEELPQMKYFIAFDKEDDDEISLSYNKFIEMGKKEIENGNSDFVNLEHKDTQKLKMLVYTSGTTDQPKGVMLTEHNLVSSAYYGLRVAILYTKCLSVLPYHHTYEAVSGILVGILKHSTICINDSLKNVLKNIQYYKPDYIYLVPAFSEIFYKNIWNNARKTKKELGLKFLIKFSNFLRLFGIDKRRELFKSIHEAFGGNLRKIVVGGAPLRADIGKFFNDIGIDLINGYGITECSPLVSVNREEINDPRTVGVVLPCCQIKFENVNADGDGEICVKGDIVMMGYYKDKERTERVLKDGWFNTEDYGRFNEKGLLIINGRKKNIIVLDNGKNIYPEEIESYILKVPYVSEVVVRGKKDENGHEHSLMAEVFLNSEKVKELGEENIEETLKKDISKVTKELPIYKHIADVKIRDEEFKKTTTNKIKR